MASDIAPRERSSYGSDAQRHHQTGGSLQRSRFVYIALITGFAITSACATTKNASQGGTQADRITESEIIATPAANAYDLVQHLRPDWLRVRPVGSISGSSSATQTTASSSSGMSKLGVLVTLVYLDGNKLGEIDALRSLPTNGIREMRWLDPTRAHLQLRGIVSDAINGAIDIKSK
ncbi:MAG TPA: hypothetical protein VNC11_12490 [Gemmatimonadaceae bacterium]|nr:hypothetical protein [Gemmatimonadaceae bacterium]